MCLYVCLLFTRTEFLKIGVEIELEVPVAGHRIHCEQVQRIEHKVGHVRVTVRVRVQDQPHRDVEQFLIPSLHTQKKIESKYIKSNSI